MFSRALKGSNDTFSAPLLRPCGYREAIETWRALDTTLDLVLCELVLGADPPDASAAMEARDIFAQIGAAPFLERLDEAPH